MGYWNTRGLRGSALEEMINITNELYRQKKIALIQKIPTPIKPINIDKEKRVITLAYFEQKSTVDYIGVAQGVPICFDAKETSQNVLPIANIHAHQIQFMKDFSQQGGEAFLVVYFRKFDEYYFMDIDTLESYYYLAKEGGKKSINYQKFNQDYKITVEGTMYLNYLKTLDKYLSDREGSNYE